MWIHQRRTRRIPQPYRKARPTRPRANNRQSTPALTLDEQASRKAPQHYPSSALSAADRSHSPSGADQAKRTAPLLMTVQEPQDAPVSGMGSISHSGLNGGEVVRSAALAGSDSNSVRHGQRRRPP